MKQAHTDRKSRYKSLMKQAHTDRNSRHKSLMNFFCTRQTRQTRQTRHTLGTLAVSMSLWEVQLQWKKYHTWKRKQLDIRAKWTFYVITLRITITMTFFLMACGWYNAKYSCWVNIETQFCKMMLYSSHNNERETIESKHRDWQTENDLWSMFLCLHTFSLSSQIARFEPYSV